MTEFSNEDYWRSIILYGLNTATYKMALGQILLRYAREGKSDIPWEGLAVRFLDAYAARLLRVDNMPQQGIRGRLTVLERAVRLPRDAAVALVASSGLDDVVPRFQSIGHDRNLVGKRFYDFVMGEKLVVTDATFSLLESHPDDLDAEIEARWGLLEGAFAIRHDNWTLSNSAREIYLLKGEARRSLANTIPFLQGYQGNTCFYCGEEMLEGDIHVDHVLPRQVVQHDEVWNLVLAHGLCNMRKSDNLVSRHYLEKLRQRNENVIGSSHPWRAKIIAALGEQPDSRWDKLRFHYEQAATVLRGLPWEDEKYVAENDAFFRRLITKLNEA